MVTKAEMYLLALQELEKSTGDILTSAIITPDGLIMSCTDSNSTQKEAFAAYGAATFKRACETMEQLSGESAGMLVFESNKHRVVTIRTGEALLIALTGKGVRMGMVLVEMEKTAQKIKSLLD